MPKAVLGMLGACARETKMRAILVGLVAIVSIGMSGSRAPAQIPKPPTAAEYSRIKQAYLFMAQAQAIMSMCDGDSAAAMQETKQALGHWKLDPDQLKELFRITLAAGTSFGAPGTGSDEWCEEHRQDVDELLAPMRALGAGQIYRGPLQAPPNL